MAVKSRCIRILYHPLVLIFFNFKPSKASKYSLVPKLFFRYVNFNWSWLTNRVLLRILMFWEKIWLCKNPSPSPNILIIFTINKKRFFSHLTIAIKKQEFFLQACFLKWFLLMSVWQCVMSRNHFRKQTYKNNSCFLKTL